MEMLEIYVEWQPTVQQQPLLFTTNAYMVSFTSMIDNCSEYNLILYIYIYHPSSKELLHSTPNHVLFFNIVHLGIKYFEVSLKKVIIFAIETYGSG